MNIFSRPNLVPPVLREQATPPWVCGAGRGDPLEVIPSRRAEVPSVNLQYREVPLSQQVDEGEQGLGDSEEYPASGTRRVWCSPRVVTHCRTRGPVPFSAAILRVGKLSCDPKGSRVFLQKKFQYPPMVGV